MNFRKMNLVLLTAFCLGQSALTSADPARVHGVVKNYLDAKHYGQITTDDGQSIYFVDKAVTGGGTFSVGQAVTFEVVKGSRAFLAEDIQKA